MQTSSGLRGTKHGKQLKQWGERLRVKVIGHFNGQTLHFKGSRSRVKGEKMNSQFNELGNNGETYGYTLTVFLDPEMAKDLETISNICNTTPACIAHNMIKNILEWENKLGEIAYIIEKDE